MQFIDTHTHLYLPEFDNDRDEVVHRAVENSVVKLLMPNIDIHSLDLMLETENRYIGICHSMIGLHPTSVAGDWVYQLDLLEERASRVPIVAVGEIGIDLYWDKTFLREQINAFKRQIRFALKNELPVVVHARESFGEVFETLEEFRGSGIKGVFHAFTGTINYAEKAIDMGFMIGIGGIVTFKNSGLDKVVREVGIENLILETDAPYLAPTPLRGKRNESSYIPLINKKLAEIFDIGDEVVAARTYSNAIELFKLKS